jgi:hypothetical protein
MKTAVLLILSVILCAASFTQAETAVIYTSADCDNYRGQWDQTGGNTVDFLIWENDQKRAFFKFDVSSLAGQTIQSVEMYVYVRWVEQADPYPVTINRVTSTWNELYVNAYFRDQVNGEDIWWNTYMGDIDETPVSSGCELGSTTGMKLAGQGSGMVSLIQGWVDGTIPNYGLCLRKLGLGGLQRCLSYREKHPQEQWARLVITYGSTTDTTTIPLKITTGNNTIVQMPRKVLKAGTVVGLDNYDIDSKVWSKRGLVSNANDIAIFYKPTGTLLPRDLLAYNSEGNRNRIYFKIQSDVNPMSNCSDYFIQLGNQGAQQATGSLLKWLDFDGAANYQSNIVGTASNFTIKQAGLPKTNVLVIKKTSTTTDQCLRFSNLNVSDCNEVRIEARIRMENVPASSTSDSSQIVRGQWSTGETFYELLSHNPCGFATVRSQQTVPTGATTLTLNVGLPTSVAGEIWVDELLIQKGLFQERKAWEPRIEAESAKFYPQIEVATSDGVPDMESIQSVHFVDGWAKFIEMDKGWVWSPLLSWKSSLEVTSEEPSTSPAIVITDDLDRLAISAITSKYGTATEIREEGYVIKFTSNRIFVGAKDERGLFYGLSYLKDLIDSNTISSKVVIDWPENRVRALHHFDYISEFSELKATIDTLITRCQQNRLNAIQFDSPLFWRMHDPNVCTGLQEIFAKVRAGGIDPIVCSFNFRDPVPTDDANETYNLSAGKWVSSEAYTFSNSIVYLTNKSDSYSFAEGETYPIVLQTASSKFELRTAGGTLLVPGTDYVLVGGIHDGNSVSPFGIQRLSGSSVPAGVTVYASYNYLANVQGQSNWRQTCMSEPRVYELAEQEIRLIVQKLKPRSIHISGDEIVSMNTDSRDLVRGLTAGAIYADSFNKMNAIIKGYDPTIEVIIHGDPANLYHKRGWIYGNYGDIASTVIAQLASGIIVSDWSDEFMEEHKISEWFGSHSRNVRTGGGYVSLDRSMKCAREMAYSRYKDYITDGYVFYEWRAAKDYVQLEEAAKYMWSSPPYIKFENANSITLIDPISEVNDISLVTGSVPTSLTEQTFTYDNEDANQLSLDERHYQLTLPASGWSLTYGDKYGFRKNYRPEPTNCYEKNIYGAGLDGDLDKNCTVNLTDFILIASKWLNCNDLVGCQ